MSLHERIERLYAIGEGPGADRPHGSAGEQEAHDLVAGWMREAGLDVEVDAHGNLLGRVPGAGREVWTGSHLDSVPQGGRFDGPLGVLGGLEAVARVRRPGLTVVAFRGEEVGCVGSRARCETGPLPDAYLELHIEQGPVLARAGTPLGIVTGIVGYARAEVELTGAAGHAGTTPMDARDDALVKAAEFVLRVREAAGADAVATVGRLTVEPGAANVIPARVLLTVDARALDRARLGALLAELGLEPFLGVDPAPMDPAVRGTLGAELESRGLPAFELPSGAGHDAGILAAAGVPSGMLFVRSLNGGVSHSPEEWSDPADVDLAVEVLAGTLARLSP